MARGTQFLQLVTRLRQELRRATSVAVGVDDLPSLKATINHQYDALYMQRDWAHLRKVFALPLAAGQRYYDLPDGLNDDRIERVSVGFNGLPYDINRGIDFEEYAQFDSDVDERNDPAQRFDVRYTGTTQIEVWPIPATNDQTMRFRGIQKIAPLVNDTDVCLLDDTLIVLFAAAELASATDAKDADKKLSLAQEHLRILTARMRGGSSTSYRLGLGMQDDRNPPRITVRVGS